MATVGELLVKLKLDSAEFTSGMEKAKTSLTDAGKKMGDIGKTMSVAITAPLTAIGVAGFNMAADLQDAMGATEQIYGKAGEDVKQWASTLETYYGVAEGEALGYANMMGTMLTNIGGMTKEEAAKQSQTLVELAGDLTAMFGGTTESAVQALTGALKGNNAMLDNYGISATQAQIESKALEMGLIAEGEALDSASKQAATLALIMEQTSAAQGQASREAEGASGQMRAFKTEMAELATTIGGVLLPIITPLIAKARELMDGFKALSPEMQTNIVIIAGIAAAIGPVLVVLSTLITTITTISAALPALGAAFAALTGPIGLAIAAVVALIAIGVALYKNWDEIKAFADKTWNAIKDKLSKDWDELTKGIETLKNNISKAWNDMWTDVINVLQTSANTIKTNISNFISTMLTTWETMKENMQRKWQEMWDNIVSAVSNAWNGISGALQNLGSSIAGWFSDLASDAVNWGRNMIQGFIDGINAMIGRVRDAASNVMNAAKEFIGFNSPSKKGEGRNIVKWGQNMVSGFADGIENALPSLQATMDRMIPSMDAVGGRGQVSNNYGGVTVQNMNVRNDADIDLVARKLFDLQTRRGRGLGMA